ncbi:polysaccharide deacetylase family protein [Tropicimonas isoalkanivorans]|uniref:Chitooligosaccharide deacetylase n=1 Tax=Tropicimonas isoalkanivorans TaxID=441112 RepID=A0A1I1KPW8_9RHOB|nr:polysaccharide deacetylase family protein [Tropicimonas isoalkanivorans]SFC62625.1 Polysaccharide deacetylase [Tropicimonas isoalkanivorans]
MALWREPYSYDFAPYADRPRIEWPNGAQIAFWVAPNIEFYELAPPPSPTREVWYRPEPDILNYSMRDYGNRVGFDRMADVMARYGVRGSVSLNVAVCDHFPEIIERCCELEWELFSHGVYNTRYLYNMTEDQQREIIRHARETIKRASGQELDGWLSPAISNGETTQDLLAEEGIKYTLDLFHDDQPMPVKTRSSNRLVSVPYMMECNDVPVLNFKNISPRNYIEIIKMNFDRLYAEGEKSGTVMCVPLHPYLIGQPHRLSILDEALDYVTSHDKVWLATGREIAAHFEANFYDAYVDWMGPFNAEAQQ